MQYNPRDFLPKDASELSDGPYHTVHYRSPHQVGWHLTSECSVNCRYCYLMYRDVKPMPKTTALALVKEMADAGVFSVPLLGGDVLLYPHLLDIIEEMRRIQIASVRAFDQDFLEPGKG